MILNLLMHITDTEQHVARKVQKCCYKQYAGHRCCGNIGIKDLQNSYIDNKFKYLSVCIKLNLKFNKTCFLQFIAKYYI